MVCSQLAKFWSRSIINWTVKQPDCIQYDHLTPRAMWHSHIWAELINMKPTREMASLSIPPQLEPCLDITHQNINRSYQETPRVWSDGLQVCYRHHEFTLVMCLLWCPSSFNGLGNKIESSNYRQFHEPYSNLTLWAVEVNAVTLLPYWLYIHDFTAFIVETQFLV